MLLPNKTKYRKAQKGGKKITGVANSGSSLSFGMFGLKALSSGRLKANQIEAARRSISRNLKREGKLWIRVFPQIPVSALVRNLTPDLTMVLLSPRPPLAWLVLSWTKQIYSIIKTYYFIL